VPVTRRALLVGMGAGGLDQVTVEGVAGLRSCTAVVVPDKGEGADADTDDLVRLRAALLERHAPEAVLVTVPDPPRDRSPHTGTSYRDAVDAWHEARARAFRTAIEQAVPDGGTVGFLVWGDPAFYDSTIRVLDRILATGADLVYDVVPGVGAISVLAARHRVVLNTVGSSVTVTTGRRLLTDVAGGADNLVVMLDGGLTCAELDGAAWDIWWGADLGTPDEALVAGRLVDVLPEIEAARAAVRTARGWVMDTYLLRRVGRSSQNG
jgi:precorrin-6A synthase